MTEHKSKGPNGPWKDIVNVAKGNDIMAEICKEGWKMCIGNITLEQRLQEQVDIDIWRCWEIQALSTNDLLRRRNIIPSGEVNCKLCDKEEENVGFSMRYIDLKGRKGGVEV
ncbi:hypothetical protein PIB30_085304 [Stylosanthes scabra]|uniref:Uncharacterized protein n=1 Tax=Stylosanthes scabra TaxID=79078 RepID=A0ABU6XSZ8_9FABA|nr:hypothetical protein [Stylosanthes scabra]